MDQEKSGKQRLEETENIRVHEVSFNNMKNDLKELCNKYGYKLDAQLWMYALTLDISNFLF